MTKENRSRSKILIVEDDQGVRRILVETLIRQDLDVEAVTSTTAALQAMERERYALVISDHRMPYPHMFGLDMLRSIRRQWPSTRLILITGYETSAIVLEAHDIGARVVLKPWDMYDLLMIVLSELAEYDAAMALN